MSGKRERWEALTNSSRANSQKRKLIIDAAISAFAQNEFSQTNLDDIADRLNISKPTIYYYAGNKEDLIFLCRMRCLRQLKDAIARSTQAKMSGAEKLEIILRELTAWVMTDAARCYARHYLHATNPSAASRLRREERVIDTIVSLAIKEGIEDRSLRPVNVRLTAAAIIGAFSWTAFWFEPTKKSGTGSELQKAYADLFMSAVRA